MHESTKTLTPPPPPPPPEQGGDYKGIVGDLIQNHARDGRALEAFSRFSCPEGVGICEQTAMSKNFLDKLVSSTSANSYSCKTSYFVLHVSCDKRTLRQGVLQIYNISDLYIYLHKRLK